MMTEGPMVIVDATHVVVAYDPAKWAAVPANNGGNSPTWQWGEELLVGFTMGDFAAPTSMHQTVADGPFVSWLARSRDAGESWETSAPTPYAGRAVTPTGVPKALDFAAPGFVLRVEGNGYHGNAGARWFAGQDRGATWRGPFGFGGLLEHPELEGMEFTARTGYVVNGPHDLFLFLSARQSFAGDSPQVWLADKTFLAQTTDGGKMFTFVSWVVGKDDPYRAVMPAPVRLSETEIVVALRRRSAEHNWVDVYGSADHGQSWVFVSKVGDTEDGNSHNGNPPAMVRTRDGRLCCVYGNRSRRQIIARVSADSGATWGPEHVLREDFRSVNGQPDLGYPRLFSRPDGKLVAVYFWCTPERPQTHIEATIFDVPAV